MTNWEHGKEGAAVHLGPQQPPRRSNVSQSLSRPPWIATGPLQTKPYASHLATTPFLSLENLYYRLCWSEMSRVQLQNIPALTFYKGALTAARRADAISQLSCIGKACKLYQPEAIRCTNVGGSGNNVDWKVRLSIPPGLLTVGEQSY